MQRYTLAMPPKRSTEVKAAALKGEEAEQAILEYLKTQNRPYNAADIALNMTALKKVTISKPIAQKALTSLSEKGLIMSKVYGRQMIVAARQDEGAVDNDQLEALMLERDQLKSHNTHLKQALKEKTTKLLALENSLPTSKLESAIRERSQENISLASRLEKLKEKADSGFVLTIKEDMLAEDAAHEEAMKLWLGRRKICRDLIDQLAGEEMTKQERDQLFSETLGLEDDGPEMELLARSERQVRQKR